MDSLQEIVNGNLNQSELEQRLEPIKTEVLSDPDVLAFLNNNQLKSDDAIVQRSISKLYEFVQEKKRIASGKAPKFENYSPRLMMNVNYIDVTYVPSEQFMHQQQIYEERQRIKLLALPKSLKEATFANFDTSESSREKALAETISYAQTYVKSNYTYQKGLYLHGPFGVGKTYLLAALANFFAKNGIETTMVHYPKFIVDMKAAIGDNTVQEKMNHLMTAKILILDDIGAESNTSWTRDDVLGVILQHRMQEEMATFFTSNFSMSELEQRLAHTTRGDDERVKASRIMQRIAFLSKEVIMEGRNRRFE